MEKQVRHSHKPAGSTFDVGFEASKPILTGCSFWRQRGLFRRDRRQGECQHGVSDGRLPWWPGPRRRWWKLRRSCDSLVVVADVAAAIASCGVTSPHSVPAAVCRFDIPLVPVVVI